MTDELELSAEYRKAMKAAGIAYQTANMTGYAKILVAVTDDYRGEPGSYRKMMAEIQRKCAKASGFPEYEQWKLSRVPA